MVEGLTSQRDRNVDLSVQVTALICARNEWLCAKIGAIAARGNGSILRA